MRFSSTVSIVGPRVVAIVLALVLTTAVATSHAECWDCLAESDLDGFAEVGVCCRSGAYNGYCQNRLNAGWFPVFSNKNECSVDQVFADCDGWDSGACTTGGGGGQGYWEPDQGCVYDHTGFCSPECPSCIWSEGPDWL